MKFKTVLAILVSVGLAAVAAAQTKTSGAIQCTQSRMAPNRSKWATRPAT
jgi:hypothetical protein